MTLRSTLATTVAALLLAMPPALAAGPDLAARTAKAREAIGKLAEQLKGELVGALQSGGPAKAVETCSIVAPQIAQSVASDAKLEIGRTGLRVRNAANAPDAFEMAQLQAFAARIAAGEDPMKVDHAEITTDPSGAKTFRYMKAIPMAEKPCAACHGSDIKAELKAEIDMRYPNDTAVDFKAGELRGAFTVKQKVE